MILHLAGILLRRQDTKMKTDQWEIGGREWNKLLASLISHIDMPNFPHKVIECLSYIFDFDTHLIATYKKQYKPIVVSSSHDDDGSILRLFINKAYLWDPLFKAISSNVDSGLYRLQDLAPLNFEKSDQYGACFGDFGLQDEVIFLIRLEDVSFTISLGRTARLGAISRLELNRLRAVTPLIHSVCLQFWRSQSMRYVHDVSSEKSYSLMMGAFGANILTPRQSDVTSLLLQGKDSKEIADMLSISIGTLKVHRKNIYEKLNISSQAELFVCFIQYLRGS